MTRTCRCAAFALLAVLGCRATDLQLWGPAGPPPADAYEVKRVSDIAYYSGKDADDTRHRLDLFVPKGKKDFPVVVFVHGGAWMIGDNRCCGLYSTVGEFLASHGVGAVLPNYRLSPGVKHPEHIKDVARAVAWTKKHIAEHGGRPDQLFLAGHSAGGHLVALLATDEKYLKAEKIGTAELRGVIGISGVYRIPPGKTEVFLGGSSPRSLHVDAMAPLRGVSSPVDKDEPACLGLPLSMNVFGPVFGDDEKIRADASPITHVHPGLPPFLLLSAEKDLPLLPGMAEEMHKALLKQGGQSRLLKIENRNHNGIMFKAIETSDPAARAILEFINEQIAAKK